MKRIPSPDLKGLFIRPASLVIRFSDEGLYRNAIKSYTLLLDTKPKSQGAVGDYQYGSFQVGNPANPDDRDIELRLEYRPKGDFVSQTLLFWRIRKGLDVESVISKLEAGGYRKKEKDNSGHQLLGEDRCLLESPDGEFVGGHTNPPFPPGGGRDSLTRKHHFPKVGGLLAGLLGGLALASLLPEVLGLRRASK